MQYEKRERFSEKEDLLHSQQRQFTDWGRMHWTRRQRKTYEAKGRPSDNPLIVHIADLEDLSEITENVPPETELLAKHFLAGTFDDDL